MSEKFIIDCFAEVEAAGPEKACELVLDALLKITDACGVAHNPDNHYGYRGENKAIVKEQQDTIASLRQRVTELESALRAAYDRKPYWRDHAARALQAQESGK